MEQEKRDLSKLSKAELLEEAKALQNQVEELEREERYATPAKEMAAYKRALVKEGFTEEQAMEMIMVAIKAASLPTEHIGRRYA